MPGITVEIMDGRVVGHITSEEFAKKCGVEIATVRMWIRRGKIKNAIKIGSDWWIGDDEEYPKRKKREDTKSQNLFYVGDVSEMFKVNPETVRRWIRNGELKAFRNSRKSGNIIKYDDLREFAIFHSRKTYHIWTNLGI